MNEGEAYLNGEWIDAHKLAISVDDLGFTVGATVVERLRTFGGAPYRVAKHIERLRHSLDWVGWNAEGLTAQVEKAIHEFARRNAPLIAPGDDWSIVAFVTPGATADASKPTVCVHGFPIPFAGWASQFERGVELSIVDVRQIPASCVPPQVKCRSRIHYYLADQRARRNRPGSRALLLDQQGFVGEASTANVVAWYEDRGLVTPRLDAVLPGISQAALFEIADDLGMSRTEADMSPQEFAAADEAFLTSTSICLLPVVAIDGAPVGDGEPGPVYRQLLAAWSARVGVDVPAQAVAFANRKS